MFTSSSITTLKKEKKKKARSLEGGRIHPLRLCVPPRRLGQLAFTPTASASKSFQGGFFLQDENGGCCSNGTFLPLSVSVSLSFSVSLSLRRESNRLGTLGRACPARARIVKGFNGKRICLSALCWTAASTCCSLCVPPRLVSSRLVCVCPSCCPGRYIT